MSQMLKYYRLMEKPRSGQGQQEAGGRGAAVLFLVTCLCIPVHNYLKLKEEGERHRKEARKIFL